MGHHYKPEEPLNETVSVLSYEAGRLLEQSMYYKWTKEDPARKAACISELQDVAFQVILVCESLGVLLEDMVVQGREKAEDRFNRKDWKYKLV
jgi:NTP pyrophosphatase (non-canonical NTP hydrolase)